MSPGSAAIRKALSLLLTAFMTASAMPQTVPNKPIRLIASTPPGGTIDLVARLLAQNMSASLGRPVIVENKAGAAGNIAADYVAQSPADGTTLLVTASSHATNVNLYPRLSYDPVKDFAPVSLLTTNSFVLVVPASSPANSTAEFLALAKSKKGALNYGSSGSGQGNHLGMELLKSMGGFDAAHVPYNGTGPVTIALLAGQVDVALQTPPGVVPYLKSGKLKALATTGKTRSPLIPNVPTLAESGVPGYELLGWIGLLAPAGTPKGTIETLQRAARKALNQPDVLNQLHAVAADVVASTPQEFSSFLDSEISTWAQVIKKSGARAE
jgi:tripartite-type tricarboxylate transporter receptor subunit TctC